MKRKQKTIYEEAGDLAKMTMKGMSQKEKDFWRDVFKEVK